MTGKRKTAVLSILAAAAAAAVGSVQADAASISWDNGGADNTWSTAANWAGDVVPTSTDRVQLTGGIASGATVSLGASQTISELRMENYSGVNAFTIGTAADKTAGYVLTLTNVYRGDNNGNTQTIAANVKLAGDSTWNIINGYNGSVASSGVISSDAAVTFTKDGSNGLALTGNNTFSGGVRVFAGTLALGGTNAYAGGTTISGGALLLNFNAGASSPASDILANGSGLVLGGVRGAGSVTINGKNVANALNSQTLGGLTVNAGSSSLSIVNGISTGKTVLNLGVITRNTGGIVNFVQPTVGTAISAQNGYVTSTTDTNGILGAWATVGGTDWATNNDTSIVAYTNYAGLSSDAIVDGAANNVRVLNGGTSNDITQAVGTTNLNTFLYNDTASRTVVVGAGNTLRFGQNGGILKLGAGSLTIGAAGNAGSVTAGGADNTAGELVVNAVTTLTVNSEVANNGTGAVTLTKAGSGLTVLNAVNTHSGGTYVTAGTLAFAGTSGASTVASMANNATSLTVANATGMVIGQSIVGSNIRVGTRITNISGNTLTISTPTTSSGTNVAVTTYTGAIPGDRLNNVGHIVVTGGTLEFGNNLATQSTSGEVIMMGGAISNGTLTKSGTNFDFRAGTVATALAGNVGITKTTGGTLTFGNVSANTFTGDTTITEGAVIGGQNANAIAISGNLIVGSVDGTAAASYSNAGNNKGFNSGKNLTVYANGSVNMGGGDQYVGVGGATINIFGGSVTGTQIYQSNVINMTGGSWGGTTYGGNHSFNTLASSTTAVISANLQGNQATKVFTVADGAATIDLLLSGGIASGNMQKAGTGFMESRASKTYTGITSITGGVLSVSSLANGGINSGIGASAATAANLVLAGGMLQYTGAAVTIDRLFTLGSATGSGIDASGTGALVLSNTGSVAFGATNNNRSLNLTGTNTDDNTLAAAIGTNGSGVVSVNKTGDGKWIYAGTAAYTGATNITAGTLALATGASLGNTNVSVDGETAVFAGKGTVGGNVTVTNGILAPGIGDIGTLTVNGNVTIAGTLVIDLDPTGDGTADKLVVTGAGKTLDINNAKVSFVAPNGADDIYIFASYSTLSGVFAPGNISGLNPHQWVDYNYEGTNQIAVVPEPASASLLLLGAGATLIRRRRRAGR